MKEFTNKTYTILERRLDLGGTWDLFKYPGIRSDSDMFTFAYSWYPWTKDISIADGPDIKQYLKDAATKHGIDKSIQFGQSVDEANYNSNTATWTITTPTQTITCQFLFFCSGYYNYDSGYTPVFEGVQDYKGEIIHPQKWKKDTEYANKEIIVIGSGATAITVCSNVPTLLCSHESYARVLTHSSLINIDLSLHHGTRDHRHYLFTSVIHMGDHDRHA